MHGIKKLLLVDDSKVLRAMMTYVLRPHCDVLLTAACCEEGLEAIAKHPDLCLAVCDVVLPDGDGFELLRRIRDVTQPPEVVLVTARPSDSDRARAHEMGALEYLTKPICFKDIAGAWKKRRGSDFLPNPRIRRPPIGHALMVDPDTTATSSSLLRWEIHDISLTGAFLATNGPMELGSELALELVFGDLRARIPVVVTRVQEPSWAAPGGVAVRFKALDPDAKALLLEMHNRFGDYIS